MVTSHSSISVWWKCNRKDYEWIEKISNRANNRNCPYCSGHKTCLDNCLFTLDPYIAKQWYSNKNELTPYDVTCGSNKKVWWQCKNGHE